MDLSEARRALEVVREMSACACLFAARNPLDFALCFELFLVVSRLVGGSGLPLDRVANDPIVEPRPGLAGLEAVVWASSTPQERMVTSTTPHAAWRTWCENFLKGGPPGLVQVPFDLSEFNAAAQLLREILELVT